MQRYEHDDQPVSEDAIAALRNENARLRAELEAYREAVTIDVRMEGPIFAGCNLSQLRRAYEMTAALEGTVQ